MASRISASQFGALTSPFCFRSGFDDRTSEIVTNWRCSRSCWIISFIFVLDADWSKNLMTSGKSSASAVRKLDTAKLTTWMESNINKFRVHDIQQAHIQYCNSCTQAFKSIDLFNLFKEQMGGWEHNQAETFHFDRPIISPDQKVQVQDSYSKKHPTLALQAADLPAKRSHKFEHHRRLHDMTRITTWSLIRF